MWSNSSHAVKDRKREKRADGRVSCDVIENKHVSYDQRCKVKDDDRRDKELMPACDTRPGGRKMPAVA